MSTHKDEIKQEAPLSEPQYARCWDCGAVVVPSEEHTCWHCSQLIDRAEYERQNDRCLAMEEKK